MSSGRFSPLSQVAILVGLALGAGAISNQVGPRERRLAWVRDYPDALSTARLAAHAPTAKPRPARAPAAAAVAPAARPLPEPSVPPAAPRRAPAGEPTRKAAAVPANPPPAAKPTASSPLAAELAPHPGRPWEEITPEQARRLFDQGALFLDARRSSVYRDGHIARARSMAVWEADVDDKVKAFFEEGHDSNAPLVVYCSGGDCEDSHQLAQKLWGAGFDAVFVYKDGFPDWQRRGWPVEKGDGR